MSVHTDEQEFDALLQYLKRSRGFDFTGYKQASLKRRVSRRMQATGMETPGVYTDYLEVHPEEFTHLFNAVLINTTGFFRDPDTWDYLAAEIIPQIGERKLTQSGRIWSAGCASGEEAYTLAMVLGEVIGAEHLSGRVKVYATDVDEEALAQARQASYSAHDVETVPQALRDKYFERADQRYVVRQDLRHCVIFGRHDLVQDAPISRIDLLVCRNTMIYFNTETQARILARFGFALNEGGFLFLGRSEMLLSRGDIFAPVDPSQRIFARLPKVGLDDRSPITQPGYEGTVGEVTREVVSSAAFENALVGEVVVDPEEFLVAANHEARALFGLTSEDLGKPLETLGLDRKTLGELRGRIRRAYSERGPSIERSIEWSTGGGVTSVLDVQVVPVLAGNGRPLGASITFADVSRYHGLQEELERARRELQTAYEELQSTNEETRTINAQLRERERELSYINTLSASVLASLRAGVIVIDRDLRIQVWNDEAHNLWGLRTDEVEGRSLQDLDIGLPVERLEGSIQACLAGESTYHEVVLQATNRRGRDIECKVVCAPLIGPDGDFSGVILFIETGGAESPRGRRTRVAEADPAPRSSRSHGP